MTTFKVGDIVINRHNNIGTVISLHNTTSGNILYRVDMFTHTGRFFEGELKRFYEEEYLLTEENLLTENSGMEELCLNQVTK